MTKFRKAIVVAVLTVLVAILAITPVLAYNGITAGTAYQPPILRNWSQTGWTPYGYDNANAQNVNGEGWQNLRFYPKPDGGTLPAMGWNSWNAFASNITEARIRGIADSFIDLGLDKVGYKYVVIDDGCYQGTSRPLANHPTNFPSGFKVLSDYVHGKGLLYGMYQDSGPRTCGGQTGAYGYEDEIGAQMVGWGVDYLKYDFCGNPFGMQSNYWVGGGPNVRSIQFTGNGYDQTISWASAPAGVTYIGSANRNTNGYLASLGITAYGSLTNPSFVQGAATMSITGVPADGEYTLTMSTGSASATAGRYLVVEINGERQFERLMPNTGGATTWQNTTTTVSLKAGTNQIRLCCPKNQEIGLYCYGAIRDGMNKAGGENIVLSMCDWGYFGAHTYGWQIGESARTSEDIANVAGQGNYSWTKLQYDRVAYGANRFNKLGGSWMDPDMMVVGLRANSATVNFTWDENMQHFAAWCILNAPLMLGCDLTDSAVRNRVMTGDGDNSRTGIITNRDLIWLNQDPLGVSGKRIKMSAGNADSYVTTNRMDCIVKPLSDGDVGVYFGSWGTAAGTNTTMTLNINEIIAGIGDQMINTQEFANAGTWYVKDVYTTAGTVSTLNSATQNISVTVAGHASRSFRISTKPFTNRNYYAGVGLSFDQLEFKYMRMPKSATEFFNNRANAIATVSNDSAANINARIKIDIYNRRGVIVDTKLGDIKVIEPGCLVSWELKYEITDNVYGYTVKASLLNADTSELIAPAYSVTNDEVGSTIVNFNSNVFAGNDTLTASATYYNDTESNVNAAIKFELFDVNDALVGVATLGAVQGNVAPETTAAWTSTFTVPAKVFGYTLRATIVNADTGEELSGEAIVAGPPIVPTGISLSATSLVGSATVTATGTVNTLGEAKPASGALILFALYNADGSLADAIASTEAVIDADSITTFTATYTLPTDVAGKSLRAWLLDAGAWTELAAGVAAPPSAAATDPSGSVVKSSASVLLTDSEATVLVLYKNTTGAALSANAILACYNAKGALLGVSFGEESEVADGGFALVKKVYTTPANAADGLLKVFLWESKTFIPLIGSNSVGILDYIPANKTALAAAISAGGAIDLSLHSPATGAVLTAALNAGQVVYDTLKAPQLDVDNATAAINSAINGLAPSAKVLLGQRITAAKALNVSSYNLLSAELLEIAIADAELVYNNPASVESAFEAEITALSSVISGLVDAPGGLRRIGPRYRLVSNAWQIDTTFTDYVPATPYGAGGAYSTNSGFERLFDGSATTIFDASTATNAYGGMDLGANNAVTVNLIRYYPRESTSYCTRANNCTFRASNSTNNGTGTATTLLYTITGLTNTTASYRWYEVTPANTTTAFRYVWFQSNATNSYGNLGEVEFYTLINILDKSLLDFKVAEAVALTQANYTPVSWAALAAALTQAQAAQAHTDIAQQSAVNAATASLKAAIAGLVRI